MDKERDIHVLRQHPRNPREMSAFMEDKLVENILVFPKMLNARPMVVNKDNFLLRGNQRVQCLNRILELDEEEMRDLMVHQKSYREMSDDKKDALVSFWLDWQKKPMVKVRESIGLTPDEEVRFMLTDNLHFGEDDMDVLRHNYDRDTIRDIIGTEPWNYYTYNDKINDDQVDNAPIQRQTFECGYVVAVMTDSEASMLKESLDKYLSKTGGSADGFLSCLLGLEQSELEQADPLPF